MGSFRDSGSDQHVTLLLGAGASAASGLPGWEELAVRLLRASGSVPDEDAAWLLVNRQDPLLVAEAARRRLGKRWDQYVRAALYSNLNDLSPSPLHIAAASHALAGDLGESTVITLNFDTLIEDAIDEAGDAVTAEPRIDDQRPAGTIPVHHLHGVASVRESQDVVLTLSDFNELLGDPDSWQQRLLIACAKKGAIVIAGTSYRDPDVRRWLHVALAAPDASNALVLLARESFHVTRPEFDQIKEALADQWSAAGLTPVILEDHSDAAQIIRELRHLHAPGYRAPQERAATLWQAHVDSFQDLQQAYSDQLLSDATSLCTAFNVDRLNATLWIADGQGNVARYAAQDRCFRSIDDVRHVPSGHDSQWIAGRALGAEATVFQDLQEGTTSRWGTVFATPIRVELDGLPGIASAVLSVGLPGSAETYFQSTAMWMDTTLDIAVDWGERLVASTGSVSRT
ncbi:SIR2 family protein [Frigoribacterium sp. VKM Ac-2836]|nr:SIR2 family protein [Frigoribacterium sp. VKM Ac-2836]